MTVRPIYLLGTLLLLSLAAGSAMAIDDGRQFVDHNTLPIEQQRFLNDPPRSHLEALHNKARPDTIWFGGLDPSTGLAYRGGPDAIWDFEDCTPQGWICEDLTDIPLYFRHTAPDSFIAHGDTDYEDSAMGDGSAWCGAYADEADEEGWPGGRGYSNRWDMFWRQEFTYGGGGSVTLTFDYFVDSEQDFDFSYVYVFDDSGNKSDPLNTCQYPNDQGSGYSGSHAEGSGIGAPENPAHEQIIVNAIWLPDSADRPFEVEFNFESDALMSDGLDSYSGFLNSVWGPLGLDNIRVQGVDLDDFSDFTEGSDGWIGATLYPIGCFLEVNHLDDLDPVDDPCCCPLEGYVMTDADLSGGGNFPHPKGQHNYLNSATCDVSEDGDLNQFWIEFDIWMDLPRENGVGLSIGLDYYPWTSPVTGETGWTPLPAGESGFLFGSSSGGDCTTILVDNSSFMPSGEDFPDSIQVCFTLLGDCDAFGFDPETCSHETTNQSPYWDNIRVGLTAPINAPPLRGDQWFQDGFPREETLHPDAAGNVDTFFDRNYSDNDRTNADMGDSATVHAGNAPNSEVYLNFRVWPGPCMDWNDDWWDGVNGSPWYSMDDPDMGGVQVDPRGDDDWAVARCDTAERLGGSNPRQGCYMTFFHEDSRYFDIPEGSGGGADWRLNRNNEILPDAFFTPGTMIEYFFSSHFTGNPWDDDHVDAWPDTTGEFFLEFEILPGYLLEAGGDPGCLDVVAPCLLYVDAFNAGAQVPIEDYGLAPVMGVLIDENADEHDNWDRYDYLAAGSNIPGPLARERFGNNGMSKYQSMIYKSILYNTGTRHSEGLRDGDADLLINFLITDDYDRWMFLTGLWLSGNGIVEILDNPTRPFAQSLMMNYACTQLVCDCLHEANCPPGAAEDLSVCVRLKGVAGADFGLQDPEPYAAVRGNGCPTLMCLNVIEPTLDCGVGNLAYVDQDADGQPEAEFASVSNDQSVGAGNPANYRVVTDAFSLHLMHWIEDPWNSADCGTTKTAITRRCEDVLGWLNVSSSQGCPYDYYPGAVDQPDASIARTVLFRNAPNPFNPQTTVRYDLAEKTHVRLQIFDVSGRLVRTLVDRIQKPDAYRIEWDGLTDGGEPVSSGVFWARLMTGTGYSASTKMVVLR